MKKILCTLGGAALVVGGLMHPAQADVLTLTDEIMMVANGNTTALGTVTYATGEPTYDPADDNTHVETDVDFRYVARERDSTSQTDRRVATFLKFDTSGLTTADVNDAGFSATFSIDYCGHLNDQNVGMDLGLGRVDDDGVNGDSWDDDGSNNPDFAWGLSSADQSILLVDVDQYEVATTDDIFTLTVDVTSIVQDWVLGNEANNGLTLFGVDNGANGSNAAYLDNASLTVIPEPATIGLFAAFGGGVLFIRRRFMM